MAIAIIVILGIAAYLLIGSNAAAEANTTGTTFYGSDGSLTGSQITQDAGTWPGDDRIWEICAAIATAEGYQDGPGYVPFDLNNPGDISDGAATFGSQPHSGSNVTTFPTAETGWQWLYNKVSNIVTGKSSTYPASFTWQQVAVLWAGNSSAWLSNVTSYLGVDPLSTPAEYVNG